MQTRSRTVEIPNGLSLPLATGHEHSSDWLRSVSLLPERKRQFAKPPLNPIGLDGREVLTVHTRRALVGAALGIGMSQDVPTANLVV